MKRRTLLHRTVLAGVATSLGLSQWRSVFASSVLGEGPYGGLGPPNPWGVALPDGFSARVVAITGEPVGASGYLWHPEPDGAATFATDDGGWLYVANSEDNGNRGGVGVIRFAPDGGIVDAYRILTGTKWNCSGGATPWGTWLSCEETRGGLVWECDPTGPGQGIARPAMGTFAHEAAVVDPITGYVYLTEDEGDSRLYRFLPHSPGDLSSGELQAAAVDLNGTGGSVRWITVSPKRPYRGKDTTPFTRGEGAWFSAGVVYFCTTADNRVWALTTATDQIEIIYDAAALGPNAPLRQPDNVTVHERSGDIYVAEDADDLQLVLLANVNANGPRVVAPFLQLFGHGGSEIAGPAFSPDGSRLYFSSQRGIDGAGITFEVTGPFVW